MTDQELNDQNLAHLPPLDDAPAPSTHVTPTTRTSVAREELAVGAAPFDPNPPAHFEPRPNPQDYGSASMPSPLNVRGVPVGEMSLPPVQSNPSGARITPVNVGADTTGR